MLKLLIMTLLGKITLKLMKILEDFEDGLDWDDDEGR